MPGPRILYVVTHPMTVRYLLAGQLAGMRARGFEVAVACAPGQDLDAAVEREGVTALPVPIRREIAPLADVRALAALRRVMRRWRPDVVNAATPKAGLLGMLAARMMGVPVRIYHQRGLRLETTAGLTRTVLETAERVAAGSAHEVVAVSPSLACRFVELGLAPAEKVRVLGQGASNGVRIERFESPDADAVDALRTRLKLDRSGQIVGYVGRFTRDKGIVELVEAVERVRTLLPDVRLLLVGDFEAGDPVPEQTVRRIEAASWIVRTGFLPDTAPAYALMDVLAFPSYREGFPNVPLEAAAAGLPVAGCRATGTVDAVVDGQTGTLVEVGDTAALADALRRYLGEPALRERHGRAGQERVRTHFQPEQIWEALLSEYNRLLGRAAVTSGEVRA